VKGLEKKLEKKSEKLKLKEEKMENWKDKQEERHDDEINKDIKQKEKALQKVEEVKAKEEKKSISNQVSETAFQVEIKNQEQLIADRHKKNLPVDQEKKTLEELKKALDQVRVQELKVQNILTKEKAEEKKLVRDLETERKEIQAELKKEKAHIEKKIEKDTKKEEQDKQKQEKVEKKIRKLGKEIHEKKFFGEEAAAKEVKQLENKQQEFGKKVEKLFLQGQLQREKKNADTVELHQKQVEAKEAKISKEQFQLNQLKEGERQIQQDLLALETKKKRLDTEIKASLAKDSLTPKEEARLEQNKIKVAKIQELVKNDKQIENFLQSNNPVLVDQIVQKQIKMAQKDLKNKQQELETKEKQEVELKQTIDKLNQDLQQKAVLTNEQNPVQKLELKEEKKRQKQLEKAKKELEVDAQLLKKEIETDKKIQVQLGDLKDTQKDLAQVVMDRVAKEQIVKELKEAPKVDKQQVQELKKVIKEELKSEKNARRDSFHLMNSIAEEKLEAEADKQKMLHERMKNLVTDKKKETEKIKTIREKLDQMKKDPLLAPEKDSLQHKLEVEKMVNDFDKKKLTLLKKLNRKSERITKKLDDEKSKQELDFKRQEKWNKQVNSFKMKTNSNPSKKNKLPL